MALQFVITNAGRAALIDPATGGSRAVRIAAVGVSPVANAPDPSATTLPGEVKRIATIAGDAVAADILHLVVRDESADAYTVRSFALYLGDGTLFGLYGQPAVILEKSTGAVFLLAVDLTLANLPTAAITFGATDFLNPPATIDRAGVIELATAAEASAGVDPARAVTPATAKAAVRDWIGYQPASRAGDTFSGDVLVRTAGITKGLTIAQLGTGYGFAQFGEANVSALNWHMGSGGDGSFALYQGNWGTGTLRLAVTATSVTFNGALIWNAANDGAGSGLDADLLDGLQGAQFMRRDVSGSVAADVSIDFGNSVYGRALRVGGRLYTAAGAFASLVTTDGNLHVDAATGCKVFLNYYAGDGVVFGNGSGGIVAALGKDGAFSAASVAAPVINRAGAAVWGPDNDGAGSALDADLLDGRDGTWYADVPARLGYAPANRGGEVFTGNVAIRTAGIAKGLTIAQVGSGYGFAQYGEAPDQSANWHVGSPGDGSFGVYQGNWGTGTPRLVATSTAVTFNGALIWNAANDGAGSGLDADLLDGLQGAQFMRRDVSSAVAPDVSFDFGNSVYGKALRIGGRLYTAAGALASLVTTDGNLHTDPATGCKVFLNYYAGDGVVFGNGAGGIVAAIGKDGAFSAASIAAPVINRAGAAVWGPDNDGAGSGLDADLLDGRDGAWYADVPARLGYAPANRGGDVFTGNVTIHTAGIARGLTIALPGTGYGFAQFGEAPDQSVNWHVGSPGDGSFGIYQGNWGTGVPRLAATSTAVTFNGALIWNAANDGAGSGLDADLLDGLQGAQFMRRDVSGAVATDVSIDFGNSAFGNSLRVGGNGYTSAGGLASVVTTNGNLHLDPANGRKIFMNFYAGDGLVFGNGATTIVAALGADGAFSAASVSSPVVNRAGAPLWGSDNDGAGSGLDADLLDGHDSSDFVFRSAFAAASLAGNGYQVLPGGLILQWVTGGQNGAGSETAQFVSFPIAFPNACLQAFVTTRIPNGTSGADAFYQLVGDPATNGCTVQRQLPSNPYDSVPTTPRVFAIGY